VLQSVFYLLLERARNQIWDV